MGSHKSEREQLIELPVKKFTVLRPIFPSGSLEGYKAVTGLITFYWRGSHQKKIQRVKIGYWDPKHPPKAVKPSKLGYTIDGAAVEAQRIAMIHLENINTGGYMGAIRGQKEAERQAKARKAKMTDYTLQALLTDYVAHQKILGRKSYSDAQNTFNNHVFSTHPELSGMVAKDITAEQFSKLFQDIHTTGKQRTANKLRSYMQSAYSIAAKAGLKHGVPDKFKEYGITANPVASTIPSEHESVDKRPLNTAEMQMYWRLILNVGGLKGQMLRLHLLTGAQRIEQFVQLLKANVTDSTIMLYDSKGKPGKPPRENIIPLIEAAKTEIPKPGPCPYLFTTDDRSHVVSTTLSKWAQDAVGDQIAGFQLKRVRSGVETLLAANRVNKDIRGRLQSHGVSGVQSRHYDGHSYQDEKLEALEIIFNAVKTA